MPLIHYFRPSDQFASGWGTGSSGGRSKGRGRGKGTYLPPMMIGLIMHNYHNISQPMPIR